MSKTSYLTHVVHVYVYVCRIKSLDLVCMKELDKKVGECLALAVCSLFAGLSPRSI